MQKTNSISAVFLMALSAFTVKSVLAKDSPTTQVNTSVLRSADVQQDYPAMCLDRDGTPWVVYIAHDGYADQLMLARNTEDGLREVSELSSPGLIHQPRIACDGNGILWAVWSQLNEQDVWNLHARRIVDGKIEDEIVSVADSTGNDIFCDVASDPRGRVWVAWQSLRGTTGDIFARYYDPKMDRWSQEIQVTSTAGGQWEPQLAFVADDEAAVVFDSSDGDSFDVVLATVRLDGTTSMLPIATSPSYEGRASIAASADRKGFWIAWERGLDRWGGDRRGHAVNTGLNALKQIDVVYVDAATKNIQRASNVKPLLAELAGNVGPKAKNRSPAPITVNRSQLFVDRSGTVYLMCRYARNNGVWHIALTRYDAEQDRWAVPITLPSSSFNQDRYCCGQADEKGNLWLVWPSDLRTTKKPGIAGVYLARMAATTEMTISETSHAIEEVVTAPRNDPARQTPKRQRGQRYQWDLNGKTYGLYWGDFHRHTSFSNCRTITDGCIVEQFRYAYDAGKLDFLGTSDHTDIAKAYSPYEWWENQKIHDLFQVPDFFNTFYVYEREQRWPWGHRNVIFARRGAPIIYINRKTYQDSPWAEKLSASEGPAEILPQELWRMLRQSVIGRRASAIPARPEWEPTGICTRKLTTRSRRLWRSIRARGSATRGSTLRSRPWECDSAKSSTRVPTIRRVNEPTLANTARVFIKTRWPTGTDWASLPTRITSRPIQPSAVFLSRSLLATASWTRSMPADRLRPPTKFSCTTRAMKNRSVRSSRRTRLPDYHSTLRAPPRSIV